MSYVIYNYGFVGKYIQIMTDFVFSLMAFSRFEITFFNLLIFNFSQLFIFNFLGKINQLLRSSSETGYLFQIQCARINVILDNVIIWSM